MKNKNILSEKKQYTTILYHGTSTAFLRSIFKQGLIPDPPKRSLGDPAIVGTGLDSYRGVYFTKDTDIAVNGAQVARSAHGGNRMIVAIQYAQGSGSVDEDSIFNTLFQPVIYYKEDVVNHFEKSIKYIIHALNEGNDTVAMTRRSELLLRELFKISLGIIFDQDAFDEAVDNGDFDDYDDYIYDRIRQLEHMDGSWFITTNPAFRQAMLKFMNSLKIFAKPGPYAYPFGDEDIDDDEFSPIRVSMNKHIRITRPVGFTGRTRIIKIYNIDTGEVYYNDKNSMLSESSFISERISLVKHRDDIKSVIQTAISTGIANSIFDINFYIRKKRHIIKRGGFDDLFIVVFEHIINNISAEFVDRMSSFLSSLIGKRIFVDMENMGQDIHAYVLGTELIFNHGTFRDITDTVITIANNSVLQDPSGRPYDLGFEYIFKELISKSKIFSNPSLNEYIDEMVSTTLHELTHLVQNSKSLKAGGDIWSSSYLERNQEKYRKIIDKGDAMSPEEYKIYQGNPKEISAFAQETAERIVAETGIDRDMSKLLDVKKNPQKFVTSYVYKDFNKPSNHIEYKIFKRYIKLVYQYLIDYIDYMESKKITTNR